MCIQAYITFISLQSIFWLIVLKLLSQKATKRFRVWWDEESTIPKQASVDCNICKLNQHKSCSFLCRSVIWERTAAVTYGSSKLRRDGSQRASHSLQLIRQRCLYMRGRLKGRVAGWPARMSLQRLQEDWIRLTRQQQQQQRWCWQCDVSSCTVHAHGRSVTPIRPSKARSRCTSRCDSVAACACAYTWL